MASSRAILCTSSSGSPLMPTKLLSAFQKTRNAQFQPAEANALSGSNSTDTALIRPDAEIFPVGQTASGNREDLESVSITRPLFSDDGSREVYICLAEHQAFAVVGVFYLTVLYGSVRWLGAVFQASERRWLLYGPLTHAIPSITALSDGTELLVGSVSEDFAFPPAIRISGIWDYPREKQIKHRSSKSIIDLQITQDVRAVKTKHWDHTIDELVRTVSQPKCVLVCGGKGTGKSTFTTCLLNRLMTEGKALAEWRQMQNEVLLLDLDVGQPLFRPPGLVYLARVTGVISGPPFTQPVTGPGSVKADMIREYSISKWQIENKAWYIEDVVRDLIEYIQSWQVDKKAIIVVNTSTWAADIMFGDAFPDVARAMAKLSVTDIVELSRELRTMSDALMGPADDIQTHILPAEGGAGFSADDLQMLQTQTYFHVTNYDQDGNAIWNDIPLIATLSAQSFTYEGLRPDIRGIMVGKGRQVPKNHVSLFLPQSLVTVIQVGSDQFCEATKKTGERIGIHCDPLWIIKDDFGLPMLDPGDTILEPPFKVKDTRCLGLAYIDSIRPGLGNRPGTLEVHTPIDVKNIRQREWWTVLLMGDNISRWATIECQTESA